MDGTNAVTNLNREKVRERGDKRGNIIVDITCLHRLQTIKYRYI